MRRLHLVLAALAALAMAPMLAWGQAAGNGSPGTGIANTLHDFTAGVQFDSGTTVGNNIADTGNAVGLCAFCHTPHRAQTTKLLWNHTLDTGATFTWNDATTTTAGTTLPSLDGGNYNGVSTKCLSCHDGSVAIGDVAWFAEAPRTGANAINSATMGSDGDTTFVITNGGAGGSGAGSMNGNHPIGVPYPFGNAANTYNGITTGSGAVLTEWQADPTAVSNVRLFHDDGTEKAAGPVASSTGIECSSCHDPHNKQAVDDLFLRGALTGQSQADGYICLQCHVK